MSKLRQWVKEKAGHWLIKGVLEEKPLQTAIVTRRINQQFEEWNMEEKKKFWQSKTLWVNALTALAAGLTALQSPDAKVDAQTVGAIGSILAVVNIGLRLITNQGVGK